MDEVLDVKYAHVGDKIRLRYSAKTGYGKNFTLVPGGTLFRIEKILDLAKMDVTCLEGGAKGELFAAVIVERFKPLSALEQLGQVAE